MQVFAGLRYLNEQKRKIIHYDLKPANILFHGGEVLARQTLVQPSSSKFCTSALFSLLLLTRQLIPSPPLPTSTPCEPSAARSQLVISLHLLTRLPIIHSSHAHMVYSSHGCSSHDFHLLTRLPSVYSSQSTKLSTPKRPPRILLSLPIDYSQTAITSSHIYPLSTPHTSIPSPPSAPRTSTPFQLIADSRQLIAFRQLIDDWPAQKA